MDGRLRGENRWLRDLDSNQDSQLQRLVSYQLDDPGVVRDILTSVLETPHRAKATLAKCASSTFLLK
jgi:hypothetical protein